MAVLSAAVAWAERHGRDRGLRGASGAWLAVWVLVAGARQVRRLTTVDPVIVREPLRPGEQLVISHYPRGADLGTESTAVRRGRGRRGRRS